MKTPAKRGRRPKGFNPAASLISALKFVLPAQHKTGSTEAQFCRIGNHWVVASDGILTIGCPVEEDLEANPNTFQFLDALGKVGTELAITQISQGTLAVASGAFRALVPCVASETLPPVAPDTLLAPMTEAVKDALRDVAGIAAEAGEGLQFAAVLLQAGTAAATNGAALLEAWHGCDLPPNLLLPKAAAIAVAKSPKLLTGFGFCQSSITFYFEDGSFVQTKLYREGFPEKYASQFEVGQLNLWPVAPDFFVGVKAVESFSSEGCVYFDNGEVMSDPLREEASTYKIDGLTGKMGFFAKHLLAVEHAFKKAHFSAELNRVVFYSENIRGVLMAVTQSEEDPLC
jgi:hypothetical protein